MRPALWIGLAAGCLEIAIRAVQHFFFGRLLFVGADFWWGAPLLTALLIGLLSVLLVAPLSVTRLGPRLRYAAPIGLGSLGLFLLIPGLAPIAAALLATGVAVRGSSWLLARSGAFDQLVRRTVAVFLFLPALGGVGLRFTTMGREAWLRTRQSDARGPNVLLIVLDTVRAIELGLYGFKPTTSPNLDGLSLQGVVFDQAFATAPWTGPSHASVFTGHRVYELSIDWGIALDRSLPTLAEVLRSGGYATAGIVANTEYASAETGLSRGFDHYEDYQFTLAEALRWTGLSREISTLVRGRRRAGGRGPAGRLDGQRISRQFLRWLDRRPERPFFAFLNYYDAHEPYFPPEPFWSRYLPGEPRRPHALRPGASSPAMASVGERAYQGAIAYLDSQVGALLDSLRARGTLRETIVIVMGDHGEEFLEHGLMGHGNSLYAPAVRVPLLLVWRGRLPTLRVREPVSLASLPATVMELLGHPGPFPGPSLVGFWTGRPPVTTAATSAVTFARNLPSWYPVSHGALGSARLGRYRYILTPQDSTGQLYDHESDPLETRNLAKEPWAAAITHALHDTVVAIMPRGKRSVR